MGLESPSYTSGLAGVGSDYPSMSSVCWPDWNSEDEPIFQPITIVLSKVVSFRGIGRMERLMWSAYRRGYASKVHRFRIERIHCRWRWCCSWRDFCLVVTIGRLSLRGCSHWLRIWSSLTVSHGGNLFSKWLSITWIMPILLDLARIIPDGMFMDFPLYCRFVSRN